MDGFQKNTVRSFRKVRDDMRNLQAQITDLHKKLEDMMEEFSSLGAKKSTIKPSRKR